MFFLFKRRKVIWFAYQGIPMLVSKIYPGRSKLELAAFPSCEPWFQAHCWSLLAALLGGNSGSQLHIPLPKTSISTLKHLKRIWSQINAQGFKVSQVSQLKWFNAEYENPHFLPSLLNKIDGTQKSISSFPQCPLTGGGGRSWELRSEVEPGMKRCCGEVFLFLSLFLPIQLHF